MTTSALQRDATLDEARSGVFRALSVPTYPRFWLSGCCWNIARWLSLFTGSYLVYHQTGSTLLVQLVGAAYFAPMFVAGAVSGVVADRFDRLRILRVQLWLLVAVSVLVAADIIAGLAQPWHIYPAMVLIGFGGVTDMTCRRALIVDLTGTALLANAFALESISMTGGTLLGNLFGGAVVDVAGSGAAFLGTGLLCTLAVLALARVRVPVKPHAPRPHGSVRSQLAEGLRYVAHSHVLVGLLSITVIMNVFFYPYLPLVPVFAKQLGVNALWTGVLGAAAGAGSLLGAFLIAAADQPRRRVGLYAGGTAIALSALLWFALSGRYALALVALFVAGAGLAGFSTMQPTLVLYVTDEALRGRVMGVLSMAIGTLPIALFALGAVAEVTGPAKAVAGSSIIGLVALATCWFVGRSMRAIV